MDTLAKRAAYTALTLPTPVTRRVDRRTKATPAYLAGPWLLLPERVDDGTAARLVTIGADGYVAGSVPAHHPEFPALLDAMIVREGPLTLGERLWLRAMDRTDLLHGLLLLMGGELLPDTLLTAAKAADDAFWAAREADRAAARVLNAEAL